MTLQNAPIGYSHALFGGKNSVLQSDALNVDKNHNGLIDVYKDKNGNVINEIELFKKEVKKNHNYTFSFDGIKQCETRKLDIYDGGIHPIYKDFSEIQTKYKTALSKTTRWLNPYNENNTSGPLFYDTKARNYFNKNGVIISYMEDKDYQTSVEKVAVQCRNIDNFGTFLQEKITQKYGNAYDVKANDNESLTISLKTATTIAEVAKNLGMSVEALVEQDPSLKDFADWGFFKNLKNALSKERPDYSNVTIPLGTKIQIRTSAIDVGQ